MLRLEPNHQLLTKRLTLFRRDVVLSKLQLMTMLRDLKKWFANFHR